ncbi:hypothetical protein [Rhodoferax aquaticus]|uniref:Uncharacterized protein n=1 Tax=Rhodoferax aquaticus TaxID=2527691 RepID=A0A515EU87_9BURK|nr:hypothetical protein [Rhodoferax aquaticus]QDL56133.1 hypothetical protein EXZ61_19295 [Rhodoferax aquaticus]
MLSSETLAIAAHLHVLLRRKTGRVTDTEWMASNADYAAEIVRFARASAKSDGHTDLADWADKLARATQQDHAPTPSAGASAMATRLFGATSASQRLSSTSSFGADAVPSTERYVRGIR